MLSRQEELWLPKRQPCATGEQSSDGLILVPAKSRRGKQGLSASCSTPTGFSSFALLLTLLPDAICGKNHA